MEPQEESHQQAPIQVINTIKKRKLQYLGHIMREQKNTILQLIVQGKISGSSPIGDAL